MKTAPILLRKRKMLDIGRRKCDVTSIKSPSSKGVKTSTRGLSRHALTRHPCWTLKYTLSTASSFMQNDNSVSSGPPKTTSLFVAALSESILAVRQAADPKTTQQASKNTLYKNSKCVVKWSKFYKMNPITWNFKRCLTKYGFLKMWQLRCVNTDQKHNSGLKFLNKQL